MINHGALLLEAGIQTSPKSTGERYTCISTNIGRWLSSHDASVFLMAVVTCVTASLPHKARVVRSGFNSMTVKLNRFPVAFPGEGFDGVFFLLL